MEARRGASLGRVVEGGGSEPGGQERLLPTAIRDDRASRAAFKMAGSSPPRRSAASRARRAAPSMRVGPTWTTMSPGRTAGPQERARLGQAQHLAHDERLRDRRSHLRVASTRCAPI